MQDNEFTTIQGKQVLKVENLKDFFEGIYLGKEEGKYGFNYRFFSNGNEVIILGVADLHNKMAGVKRGYTVRIKHFETRKYEDDKRFYDLKVLVSKQPADLSGLPPALKSLIQQQQ